jgi:hypothetical protein
LVGTHLERDQFAAAHRSGEADEKQRPVAAPAQRIGQAADQPAQQLRGEGGLGSLLAAVNAADASHDRADALGRRRREAGHLTAPP